ncbi:MAG: aldose epimerase family protein [Alistipes sp.]
MEIEQHLWTLTPDGEAVVLYTFRNSSGASVSVTNLGAAIVAVKVPDRAGLLSDVALGYQDPLSYLSDSAAMGKSVGRVANRIAEGRMTIEGQEYRLEVNSGRNHLHGGSKGFATRLWESRVETNRVVMELFSEDGDQGYPGNLQVEVVFDFDEENTLDITYRAITDQTTPINLTNHLYLNLNGESAGSILDHELQLHCSQALEMNRDQIPTGALLAVKDTPLDFTTFHRLGDGIDAEFNHIRDCKGYDHPLVLDHWKPNILTEVGLLRSPLSGRTVTIRTSQPSVMLYTGNWLAGGCPITKSAARYDDYAGVAVECQNFPDAVNHPTFPSSLLHAGETYCQKISYQFGIY